MEGHSCDLHRSPLEFVLSDTGLLFEIIRYLSCDAVMFDTFVAWNHALSVIVTFGRLYSSGD